MQASAASPPAPATSSSSRRTRPGEPATTRSRPDHLLLALFDDPDGLAVKLLAGQGVDGGAVEKVVSLPPRFDGEMPTLIPFNGPAKKALELTFRQALRLGHNYIGTEHIVLALFEDEDDDGPLHRIGVDRDRFERDLVAALEQFTKN